MATLCDITEVVAFDHLFPVLKFHDLLRLRRVCKITKSLVDAFFSRTRVRHAIELEINEDDKTFATFLEVGFPVTRLYLNNSKSGQGIFDSEDVSIFLARYAIPITHLRVHTFSTLVSPNEMRFYERLRNLQRLEIEEVDAVMRRCDIEGRKNCPFPPNFRNLKILKLGIVHRSELADNGYARAMLEFCDKLEYFNYPYYVGGFPVGLTLERSFCDEYFTVFHWIKLYLEKRNDDNPHLPNLKYLDLVHFGNQLVATILDFKFLAHRCNHVGVKLMNVNADLLNGTANHPMNSYDTLDNTIISLRNLHVAVFLMELPHLEKIVITSTAQCSMNLSSEWNIYPIWQKLKILGIYVDSKDLTKRGDHTGTTDQLLKYLFGLGVRAKLVDLRLRFSEMLPLEEGIPCPRAGRIVACCPNLTKLSLTNWPGTNKSMALLWDGLPELKEVTLDSCKLLGNVAFVGEEKMKPVFFKLKRLRKLTLKSLEDMPKITDTAFKLVFRHMKLTHFYLQSARPLKSVTIEGIKTMLGGEFAGTILKFPFRGWSLSDVSSEEFEKLEMQFRSSRLY